jgi:hypothetical protein
LASRLLGVELSGDAVQWRAARKSSSVWVASGEADGARLRLDDLKPVQSLEGEGEPFDRLAALFASTAGVAGLSAPFSLPRGKAASALLLWSDVGRLAKGGRPFGRAGDLLAQYRASEAPTPWRACEAVWRERGLELPSTLTTGSRGAAAAAVAAMTLLHRHDGPIWPLRAGGEGAILVEASPAAQLRVWGLDGAASSARPKPAAHRKAIVEALAATHGLVASDERRALAASDSHALNAVLCLWAAQAIDEGRHPRRLPMAARSEGWIVVDEAASAQPAADETTAAASPAPLVEATAEHRVQTLLERLHDALKEPDGAA